jgi:hypothetical protein
VITPACAAPLADGVAAGAGGIATLPGGAVAADGAATDVVTAGAGVVAGATAGTVAAFDVAGAAGAGALPAFAVVCASARPIRETTTTIAPNDTAKRPIVDQYSAAWGFEQGRARVARETRAITR